MAQKIKFEFNDKLSHQLKAIDSTVNLFKGLSINAKGLYTGNRFFADDYSSNPKITLGTRILDNLKQIQLNNDIFPDNSLCNGDFAIEMETGTGKTYVYLRTILQLHQDYGFKKFMIVVPSIAIKMGVKKSVEMLNEHFHTKFNIDILQHFYVYDSRNMQGIFNSFVESKDLSICLINTQAFASDTTKIKTAQENGSVLWNELQAIKPIVIIDEPQRAEGTKRKPSKSKSALKELNPLFTLKYSATHKDEFPVNFVYKLDSYGAFKEHLVKSIKVKTVYGTIPKNYPYVRYVSFTNDLKAKIEIFSQEQGGRIKFKTFDVLGNNSLHELSGKLPQYENWYIIENPHKEYPLKIQTSTGVIEIAKGENNANIAQESAPRIQINLAIKNHLDKQFDILDKGNKIKALTLFFIDEVAKVRDYSQADQRGEYLRIFDEEYSELIKEYEPKFKQYADLFPEYNEINKVRQGYFAVDKNGKEIDLDVLDEDKEYKKADQELVDKQIDLILNGKDELISFNSPLTFIFSHSALREGWDNPNIFTLCTLRKGNSDIAKKQEIGRGLRLPVDVNGKRIQEEDINELTVIANDHYDVFADNLQKDFNEKMGFNKEEVTFEIITRTLKQAGIPAEKLSQELVNEFKEELRTVGVIKPDNTLNSGGANIDRVQFTNEVLKEHEEFIKKNFIKLMQEKGSERIELKNGDIDDIENEQFSYVNESDFKKILDNLKNYMVKRSLYKFRLDKDVFINSCIEEINNCLSTLRASTVFEITEGTVSANIDRISVEKGKTNEISIYKESVKEQKSDLEIIDNIMYHTMMPRMAIIRILKGIEKRDLLNYQDILEDVTKKIAKKLERAKADSVCAFEIIDGYELNWDKIIETDIIDDEAFDKAKRVFKSDFSKRKAVNKYYKMDSAGEYDFAEKLENDDTVTLFTKLKKGGFIIDTPYGEYSPDWAVVVKEGAAQDHKMFFIIETKIDKNEEDLSGVERQKIRLSKLHFRTVNSDLLKYDWVNSYKDYRNKFKIIEV